VNRHRLLCTEGFNAGQIVVSNQGEDEINITTALLVFLGSPIENFIDDCRIDVFG